MEKKNTTRVVLYHNYVKGLKFYHYYEVGTQIPSNANFYLKREPDHAHDALAVAVYWKKHKLGYLAAHENRAVANLMDQGFELIARAVSNQPEEYWYYALSLEVSIALPKPDVVGAKASGDTTRS